MKTHIYAIAIFYLLLTSCYSQQNQLSQTIGHHKSELFMVIGPPIKTDSDGRGGEILMYAQQLVVPQVGAPNVVFWDCTYFFVNPEGKIYHYLKQRSYVPPAQVDLRVFVR